MGIVVFKAGDSQKLMRQQQYLEKIENFLECDRKEQRNYGIPIEYTTEDIIENEWAIDLKEKRENELKEACKVMAPDTVVTIPCFQNLQEIYKKEESIYDIIHLTDDIPKKPDREDAPRAEDEGINYEDDFEIAEDEGINDEDDSGVTDIREINLVRKFSEDYPEVANQLFDPIIFHIMKANKYIDFSGNNETEEELAKRRKTGKEKYQEEIKKAREDFKRQRKIISLMSEYMPTKENLTKLFENTSSIQLSNGLQDFNSLQFQDYFIPPMIMSLLLVDPSLKPEKIKEEIYKILPKDYKLTQKVFDEKKEKLKSLKDDDDENHTIFVETNKKMDDWFKLAKKKKMTSAPDKDYSGKLEESLKKFENLGSVPVNENEETSSNFYNFVTGDFSENVSKIPNAKLKVWDHIITSKGSLDRRVRNQVYKLMQELRGNASKISSLKNDDENELDVLEGGDNLKFIRYLIHYYNEIIEKIISAGLDTDDNMVSTLIKYIGNFFVYFQVNKQNISRRPRIDFEADSDKSKDKDKDKDKDDFGRNINFNSQTINNYNISVNFFGNENTNNIFSGMSAEKMFYMKKALQNFLQIILVL